MSTYKFTEILNDLWDYFILADPFTLLDYTKQHDLPDNLITNITMTDFGDKVVKEGKMIPLSNVQNYPYTIYFNLTGENIELLKPENNLQIRQDGYLLEVTQEKICFFTIPYLKNYTVETVEKLVKIRKAQIKIPNGFYSVSILAGETQQEEGKEATFEFVILPVTEEYEFSAALNTSFKIVSG
ncbi:MAG: hypothetical protein COZ18_12105 [Flexibacter sp. CG_4_10_14_3_um_filter_32_15]|nr:MAG: hypothetical protein COZ18_12105 [Flexibacter sp. CG_4_10_14_3_um_filter_32_15]